MDLSCNKTRKKGSTASQRSSKCKPLPLVICAMTLLSSLHLNAQNNNDANKLSKELVNPIGPNWVINSYLNVNSKNGDITNGSRTSSQWLLQPVMPVPLTDKKMGMTMMNRPTLPIMLKDPVPQTNAMGEFSKIRNVSGVGDLSIQSAIGSMPQANFGMYMWGVGVNLLFPTASDNDIGSQKYSAGPSAMLVGFTENFTFGTVVNHIWSYAGKSSRKSVNQSQFQPLYYMQLGNGWQIGDNPTWTMKWDAKGNNEKYDIPIGLGLFKTTHIGSMGWRFGITPRYYLKSYDSWGNDWGVSFTITPVIKNPFK